MRLQRRRALCLQFRRRDLQAPGKQQDEIHPAVIALETAMHRLAITQKKARMAKAAGDHRGPFAAAIGVGRQNLREITALDLADAGAVYVEKAVAPRLDHQKQRDQHHSEQQHAVMRGRSRQRYREQRRHHGDRPVRCPVDAVAPACHSPQFATVIVCERGGDLAQRARQQHPHALSFTCRRHPVLLHIHGFPPFVFLAQILARLTILRLHARHCKTSKAALDACLKQEDMDRDGEENRRRSPCRGL
ncbi:hypothetical protein RHECNPAF_6420073 [Rhizobium etli CNPAF512]|nr:hypothetical protein RHECNPAF_6420073 [Rhizobium etli CNPAF512]